LMWRWKASPRSGSWAIQCGNRGTFFLSAFFLSDSILFTYWFLLSPSSSCKRVVNPCTSEKISAPGSHSVEVVELQTLALTSGEPWLNTFVFTSVCCFLKCEGIRWNGSARCVFSLPLLMCAGSSSPFSGKRRSPDASPFFAGSTRTLRPISLRCG
jgi:hypothetical protein